MNDLKINNAWNKNYEKLINLKYLKIFFFGIFNVLIN